MSICRPVAGADLAHRRHARGHVSAAQDSTQVHLLEQELLPPTCPHPETGAPLQFLANR